MRTIKTGIIALTAATVLLIQPAAVAFHDHKDNTSHSHHADLELVLTGEHRSAENKARDQYRHPAETLAFFGFDPAMTVVEVSPGAGWYTEILAPAIRGKGQFYAAFYPDTGEDNYYSRTRKAFEKKMQSATIYDQVTITNFVPRQENAIAPAGSADLVLTFRNLHNWREDGVLAMFKDAFTALKPGGVLGVVEHRLPEGVEPSERNAGYFSQARAIELAKEAGFSLEATSEINANPKDKADYERGVWTLPPSYRLKDVDRDKYSQIGESDRMTLKFRKPREFKHTH